ncbi:MAG TPA: dUTP diphosphatase [bacterium]|nr:dUTP diphosphatase [bacterium]
MESPVLQIKYEPGCEDLDVPRHQTSGSSGMDIHAAVRAPLTIPPGGRRCISSGFRMSLPQGYEAQIRPRSGLALESGVTVLNSPGTIDSDYRGVVRVILINLGQEPFIVRRNDRIAQMVIQKVVSADVQIVSRLSESVRHDGGFGSTGK